MQIKNLYDGLQVEPSEPDTIPIIKLPARIVDDTHFIFVPEFWEQALKPFKKAKWTHETWMYSLIKYKCPNNYTLKQGDYLVFRDLLPLMNGGVYAAHLYMIVKEMPEGQVHATALKDRLMFDVRVDGKTIQRVELKTRAYQRGGEIFHAVMRW